MARDTPREGEDRVAMKVARPGREGEGMEGRGGGGGGGGRRWRNEDYDVIEMHAQSEARHIIYMYMGRSCIACPLWFGLMHPW